MIALPFQLFAILCGVIEAVLYCRRGAESFTRNEHVDMVLQRLSVAALVLAGAIAYRWHGSLLLVAAELVPAALLFPLCHDEAYNFTRLWIGAASYWPADLDLFMAYKASPYYAANRVDRWALGYAWTRYRYGYQSPTTTARNDFTGRQRTALAAVGALLLIGLYFYLLRV